MKYPTVAKARSWAEFSLSLPGKYFTAIPNRLLDGIVRNAELPLVDRFKALLLRTSIGNLSDFACDRVTKSQQPATPETPIENVLLKPLGQADFARILKVDKQRINEAATLTQQQGLMVRREDLKNPRLLVAILDPVPVKQQEPAAAAIAWKTFSTTWDERHPELIRDLIEAQSKAAPFLKKVEQIRRRKLADFKAAQKVPHSPDHQSPELPGPKVRNSPDKMSATPRTVSAPTGHRHGNDTRVRAETLNVKRGEQQQQPSEAAQVRTDVVVVADKLLIKEKAARKFLEECRKKKPGATVEEILSKVEEVRSTIGEHITNPMGIILTNVPLQLGGKAPRSRPPRGHQPYQTLPVPEETLEQKIENWRWLAANDPDPTAREDASKRLAEALGQSKGAST